MTEFEKPGYVALLHEGFTELIDPTKIYDIVDHGESNGMKAKGLEAERVRTWTFSVRGPNGEVLKGTAVKSVEAKETFPDEVGRALRERQAPGWKP